MTKNQELFEKYEKMKIMRPDKVQFEEGGKSYKRMKLRMDDENHYEHI